MVNTVNIFGLAVHPPSHIDGVVPHNLARHEALQRQREKEALEEAARAAAIERSKRGEQEYNALEGSPFSLPKSKSKAANKGAQTKVAILGVPHGMAMLQTNH